MINVQVKIHDNFSIEFKTGFVTGNKLKDINDFKINTWLFIPNSLDINRSTYPKDQFYKDIKTNLRLITPIYSFPELLKTGRTPFSRLKKAIDELVQSPADESIIENYTYQIKMLLSIVKSALRKDAQQIVAIKDESLIEEAVDNYVSQIREIAARYRGLWDLLEKGKVPEKEKGYFLFGDNFLGNIIEQHAFEIMRGIESTTIYETMKDPLINLIEEEREYRKTKDFLLPEKGNSEHNSLVVFQRNVLKKFVESDLFLHTVKKKDGIYVEQFYYSIAAGVAMLFATVISFIATQRFGNFTADLFIVLIVSYMLKDRIKDLMRYYFTSKLSKKYYDLKLKLSIRKQEIGWIKEAFDFIEESKVPHEIITMRNRSPLVEAENQFYDEKVILYRKWVSLSKEDIEKYKEYRLSGINDITRFNLTNFVQKMDNPFLPLYFTDEDNGFTTIEGIRVYPLHFVVECQTDNNVYHKKYRVMFNRKGIISVHEVT